MLSIINDGELFPGIEVLFDYLVPEHTDSDRVSIKINALQTLVKIQPLQDGSAHVFIKPISRKSDRLQSLVIH